MVQTCMYFRMYWFLWQIMWFNYKYDCVFTCAHVSLSWVVKTATWLHSSDSEKYTYLFSNNSDFKDINRKSMLVGFRSAYATIDYSN